MSDPQLPNIAELLALARCGDNQSRERLFRECRRFLGILARAEVETRLQSKVDASDLVQQTLFEAHRDFHKFQGRSEAEWLAWLRRILSHNAHDFVRRYHGTAKRQAHREVSIRGSGESSMSHGCQEPAAPGLSPSQEIVRRDDELRVAAALAELSADHREVILLRNLERLPFDEVATRMGRSRPAVQMLWMRAMKKLQELVGDAAS